MRHLLLAPVPRRDVLMRPVVQRLRSLTFVGALVGLVAGQLAARRLPGSGEAWAASAAVALGAMGALFVAVAVIAHVLRVPRWLATTLALLVLVAQGLAIAGTMPGPGDSIGSFALWGMRVEPADLVGIAVVVVARPVPRSRSPGTCASSRSSAVATSCRSCTSPSRCRTCERWSCCAASCAASSRASTRGCG